MNLVRLTAHYERVRFNCPKCQREVILSRVGDLRRTDAIGGEDVRCNHSDCGVPVRIVGDCINPPYQMLIFDCDDFWKEKRYISCVLNICQAYEMFFSHFLKIELLFRPFERDPNRRAFDALYAELGKTLGTLTYLALRNAFLNRALVAREIGSLSTAEQEIHALGSMCGTPSNAVIAACPDAELRAILRDIKRTDVNAQRNRVVHQEGYRPSPDEVRHYLEEAHKILFVLPGMLELLEYHLYEEVLSNSA